LAIAQRLLDFFEAAHGRKAKTVDELAEFIKEERVSGRLPEGPIDPYGPWPSSQQRRTPRGAKLRAP
jgi:hypothetical protein